MIVSRGRRSDVPALAWVMFRAIQDGATQYSVAERWAWAKAPPPARPLARKLAAQKVWVARSFHGPQGFVTLRRDGYVDLAFILRSAQGRGLFRRLMTEVTKAHSGPLTTHASLHAEPAFAAMGFEVVHRERVHRHGQRLRRCYMRRG